MVPEKTKSCRSFGTASLTIVIEPFFVFVNVHVTLSPAETTIVEIAEPSEQLVLLTQLETGVSSTE